MKRALLKMLGPQVSVYLFALIQNTIDRQIKFSAKIISRDKCFYLEICIDRECVEFQVEKELAQSIVDRLNTRLHQINGVYFKVRRTFRYAKYYVAFDSQISW